MNEIEEKHDAQAQIGTLVAAFEAKFDKVDGFEGGDRLNVIAFDPAPPDSKTIQYAVVKGFGENAGEAIANWEEELAKQPQTGRLLFWRVRPEVRYERDFRSKRTLWGIYSRFAVDPK